MSLGEHAYIARTGWAAAWVAGEEGVPEVSLEWLRLAAWWCVQPKETMSKREGSR